MRTLLALVSFVLLSITLSAQQQVTDMAVNLDVAVPATVATVALNGGKTQGTSFGVVVTSPVGSPSGTVNQDKITLVTESSNDGGKTWEVESRSVFGADCVHVGKPGTTPCKIPLEPASYEVGAKLRDFPVIDARLRTRVESVTGVWRVNDVKTVQNDVLIVGP